MIYLFVFMTSSILAEDIKSNEPIKIIINDWSSQIVLSKVTGKILESIGYKVEYPFYTIDEQFGALNLGWAHVQMEIWEGTMHEDFLQVQKKHVIDLGTHNAKTREEWWYPNYVKDLCPGLPNWEALKECSAIFSNAESEGKGVFLGGPWERPDEMMTRALGLDFMIKTAKDSDEITRYIEEAVKEKKPILVFNWTPNWTELVYEGEFVEFPAYAAECETNPKWGLNDFYTYDCGNPKDGTLSKGAWRGIIKKWPCAYAVLQNIDFSNSMIAQAAYLVDYKKMSYEDAAEEWIKKYRQTIDKWIPSSCQK